MADSLCYNKGCGNKFNASDNKPDSCTYHPGAPYFHDAYKIWSCCQKKSTDFTTWLSLPGCAKGKHNPVKPENVDVIKSTTDGLQKMTTVSSNDNLIDSNATPRGQAPIVASARSTSKMSVLSIECPQAVRTAAEQKRREIEATATETSGETKTEEIPLGTNCKANACSAIYGGESVSEQTKCVYHPGVPIFHEGMKYWSCCQRKTSEFDSFMSQEGCATGEHQWTQKAGTAHAATCRYEWFQTASLVTITVYAKGCMPDDTEMSVNETTVSGHITHGYGATVFPLHLNLWREINVKQSKMIITPSKVEIALVKADPGHWTRLQFDAAKDNVTNN
jgi:hypothetical protein